MSARVESPLVALRRFAASRPRGERCEVCARPMGDPHAHLLDVERGQLHCACEPCAVLSAGPRQWKRVERRAVRLDATSVSASQWSALGVPAGLAFFVRESATGRWIARFPGAAGAAVAVVDEDAWCGISQANPAVAALRDDVEALLVNRLGGRSESFVVSVDECFRLVSLVRSSWQGVGGGQEVLAAVGAFFDELGKSPEGSPCQ